MEDKRLDIIIAQTIPYNLLDIEEIRKEKFGSGRNNLIYTPDPAVVIEGLKKSRLT